MAATLLEAVSPFDVGAEAVELALAVPDAAGPAVGALPGGEDTGAGSTGDDVGGVDVWVGPVGGVTGAELGLVVPGVAGLVVGGLPDGEETGAGPTGDDVGVVDVWVGFIGDPTGVGGPAGGVDVGGCGDVGVGVAIGG